MNLKTWKVLKLQPHESSSETLTAWRHYLAKSWLQPHESSSETIIFGEPYHHAVCFNLTRVRLKLVSLRRVVSCFVASTSREFV